MDGTPISSVDDVLDFCFSADGSRLGAAGKHSVFPNRLGQVSIWDANSRRPLAPPLLFSSEVRRVALDRAGSRMLTVENSGVASLWDLRPGHPIAASQAEDLAEVCAGARLDPERGELRKTDADARSQAWDRLRTVVTDPNWCLAGAQSLADVQPGDSLSPRLGVRVRQSATFLLRTGEPDLCAEVLKFDPGHPLLPFGLALRKEKREGEEPESERKLSNAAYSAWLCRYGLAHLPADLSADDLRLGARLVAKAGDTLPEVKKVGLELLDRAARIAPEDDEMKKLRRALK